MFHTLYETLDCDNGFPYVGAHSTNDPYDDYLGSGYILKRAIKKKGRDNFVKFIIGVFPTREALMEAEKAIVTPEFVKRRDNYNTAQGGRAPMLGITMSLESSEKKRRAMRGHIKSPETRAKLRAANLGKTLTPEHRAKLSESHKGHKPSAETRVKMSKRMMGNTYGKGNVPWNKGKPCDEETRRRLVEMSRNRPPPTAESLRRRSESMKKAKARNPKRFFLGGIRFNSLREAQEHFGVSKPTIYRMRRKETLNQKGDNYDPQC